MDDGVGTAVGAVVIGGTAYLVAEALAMFAMFAVVGLVLFASFAGIVLGMGVYKMTSEPLPGLSRWAQFAAGGSTMLVLPFAAVWASMGFQTEADAQGAALVVAPLSFFALGWVLLAGIPSLYGWLSVE